MKRKPMIFKNSTDFPDEFLRRMLRWILVEVNVPDGYPGDPKIREIRFTNTRRSYRGTCWHWSARILVRIGPESRFPVNMAWRKAYQTEHVRERVVDRIGALVSVTAHELGHLRLARLRWHNPKLKNDERGAETIARGVYDEFERNRPALLAAWKLPGAVAPEPSAEPAIQTETIPDAGGALPDYPAAPTPEIAPESPEDAAAAKAARLAALVERRARKAAADLARWDRRLRLAKTKTAKYRAKVRRYDKIAALKAANSKGANS